MDFNSGANVILECPNPSHQKKSWGKFYIPLECDTWPPCPVCGKALRQSRRKTNPNNLRKATATNE